MYDWRKFVNLDSSVSSVEKNSVQGNEGNLYSKIFLQVVTIYLRVQNSAIGMKNSLKSQIVDETKRQTSDKQQKQNQIILILSKIATKQIIKPKSNNGTQNGKQKKTMGRRK